LQEAPGIGLDDEKITIIFGFLYSNQGHFIGLFLKRRFLCLVVPNGVINGSLRILVAFFRRNWDYVWRPNNSFSFLPGIPLKTGLNTVPFREGNPAKIFGPTFLGNQTAD